MIAEGILPLWKRIPGHKISPHLQLNATGEGEGFLKKILQRLVPTCQGHKRWMHLGLYCLKNGGITSLN